MSINLGKKFNFARLRGKLGKDYIRLHYTRDEDEGVDEIIPVTQGKIPSREKEPEIYRMAYRILHQSLEEVWLDFDHYRIIFITKEADDKFLKENKEIAEKCGIVSVYFA